MIAVRFGNVLASNGSVVPKFKAQIEAGGPVTVTHPEMVRYFMTIREACDLVITAASHALGPTRSDTSVYVLNMGQPIKIVDLAERLIRLSGLEPGRDIDIVFTGIRPGERLNEILLAHDEPSSDIGVDGVVAAKPVCPPLQVVQGWIAKLRSDLDAGERTAIYGVLREAVPNFSANSQFATSNNRQSRRDALPLLGAAVHHTAPFPAPRELLYGDVTARHAPLTDRLRKRRLGRCNDHQRCGWIALASGAFRRR